MMTIEEAILERHSVRNYQDKAIESEKISQLNELITACNKEGNLHIQLLEDAGTYNKKNVMAKIDAGERLAIVIAIGYGVNKGRPRKSKTVAQVIRGIESDMPEWFINGAKMALLAPTAVNQQKFELALKGDGYEVIDKGGILSKIDKGIVKYHFEVGSGR